MKTKSTFQTVKVPLQRRFSRRLARQHWLVFAMMFLVHLAPMQPLLAVQIGANPVNGAGAGSTSVTNVAAAAQAAALAQASGASTAVARAQAALTQANAAMASLKQAQAQAQAQAAAQASSSSVPNGLITGGLVPVANPNSTTDGLTDWIGANAPTQQVTDGQYNVTVQQTQQNAVLTWSSFNIGAQTTLIFDQQGNASWVALNRVVGTTAPSQILGHMKADGTVLVINQNGIIFGAGSQINVHSLIASTLDIGDTIQDKTIAARDNQFLQNGLFGSGGEFSYVAGTTPGQVQVDEGATLTSDDAGYLILMGLQVVNDGVLSSPDGQIVMAAGPIVNFTANTGASTSTNPNIRGFIVGVGLPYPPPANPNGYYVWNQADGLLEADRGNITMITVATSNAATGSNLQNIQIPGGAAINDGLIWSTTSVAANGSVIVDGGNIQLSTGSLIAILPDTDGNTLPTDPTSLSNFKPSNIQIGSNGANIDFQGSTATQAGATIYAPSATVGVGTLSNGGAFLSGRIFIDDGATIDVAGLPDVEVPASQNQIVIDPVKKNELANTPLYRDGFLNGATIYLDPRISGVDSNGVAWIGSPLINATAYYYLIGASVDQLMTTGGNVTLSASSTPPNINAYPSGIITAPPGSQGSLIVKSGADIDIAGGWVTYQAGTILTSQLVTSTGQIVNISDASLENTYVGVYEGSVSTHEAWGITDNYQSPITTGGGLVSTYSPAYMEGRDAGSLTISGGAIAFDGQVEAQAYAGGLQLIDSYQGTGKSSIGGDLRAVQASASQLPVGGLINIEGGYTNPVEITDDATPLPDDFSYGSPSLTTNIAASTGLFGLAGNYTAPGYQAIFSNLPSSRYNSVIISDKLLSNSGFNQVSVSAGTTLTIDPETNITLTPGGIFSAAAGRTLTVDGNVTAHGGQIILDTYFGEPLNAPTAQLGDFDIDVNADLDVSGLWINDNGITSSNYDGSAWLNAGSIFMYAAPHIANLDNNGVITTSATGLIAGLGSIETATDISGSIYVNPGATLNLTGGGRVTPTGGLNLTGVGGNLSLVSDTGYYETVLFDPSDSVYLGLPGFRVGYLVPYTGGLGFDTPVNPDQINARISIAPGSIEALGFGGGGTFNLVTPAFSFSDAPASTGINLPLSFFTTAGFANYNITSYATSFSASPFTNGEGGYDALLATQTLTIGAGQTLDLQQTVLPTLLNQEQTNALLSLPTGGNVNSVLSPYLATDAWDQKPVHLDLGGLLELDVAPGGNVIGAPLAQLTVAKLYNQGSIIMPGGTITQQEILPSFYDQDNPQDDEGPTQFQGLHPYGIRLDDLTAIFGINPDGSIDPNAISPLISTANNPPPGGVTNQNAANSAYYLLGILGQNQGIVLAPGSVTDLSGEVIVNPRGVGAAKQPILTGSVIAGGSIISATPNPSYASTIYHAQSGSYYAANDKGGSLVAETFTADPGSTIDLEGVSSAFDELTTSGYVRTPVWSAGGNIIATNGATLAGATIDAHGGAPQAGGGTLEVLNPILMQSDPAITDTDPINTQANLFGVVSSDLISSSGFDTFVAIGGFSSVGNATYNLNRAFFAVAPSFDPDLYIFGVLGTAATGDIMTPKMSATGTLTITAPEIDFNSLVDKVGAPSTGSTGNGSIIFNATQAMNIVGSVVFDNSVANLTFNVNGDLQLSGVQSFLETYESSSVNVATYIPFLDGMMTATGNININAVQVYPTTGTTYSITSSSPTGKITFGRPTGDVPGFPDYDPATPYSAGGNLTVQAASIEQGGVIRVPFGTLTLGGDTPDNELAGSNLIGTYAPATTKVEFDSGSITGVSADGLDIPYGTTTDQIEWYFSPTNLNPLTGPPIKELSVNANQINIDQGATVDLTGGGDVYAYEFVPGTGGSLDVLNQLNSDQYTNNLIKGVGYQYPDGRQVYAIVPGLSAAAVAAYDPLYSTNYSDLYSTSNIGKSVYLDGGNGIASGWYTLLPAQYAMLPGGIRIVQNTGAKNVVIGAAPAPMPDGSVNVTGYFGNALGGTMSSQPVQFSIDSQAVINSYSDIVLSSGSAKAATIAGTNGTVIPPVGADSARLLLNPLSTLEVDTVLDTTAAPATAATATTPALAAGRGAEVDIGGKDFDILSTTDGAPSDGYIQFTADTLNNLNAGSLFVGGTRTDNADGTTTLNITAQTINVLNDASHPLEAPEVIFAVDDLTSGTQASSLNLADGATIIATGNLSNQSSGDFVINGAVTQIVQNEQQVTVTPLDNANGAVFRVANGASRLTQRVTSSTTVVGPASTLNVGNVNIQGQAIDLDTSNNVNVASQAQLKGQSVSLGATAIDFTSSAAPNSSTVVITPELQGLLSQSSHLILHAQTSIGFDDGTYNLGITSLEAQNINANQGGVVNINATQLSLGNANTTTSTATDGTGVLNIVADKVSFDTGTLVTTGFGGGINITADQGIYGGGAASIFNVGNANLNMVTPYVGDASVTQLPTEAATFLTLTTGGAVMITDAGLAPFDPSTLNGGLAGSSLTIQANGISVSGSDIRATAGNLTLTSLGNVVLSNGAELETPGYTRTFGDSVDPVTKSAPGGALIVSAQGSGGIDLGNATLNVGDGTGNAGSLTFSAPNGAVNITSATLTGQGGAGDLGGNFSLETQSSIDLVALNNQVASEGFTNGFALRTEAGDLVLDQGQTLRSGSVDLTADGGSVIIGGVIDTSGINGGNIGLYGTKGVTLQSTALLNASASGYPTDDARQASGGNVTIATDYQPGTTSTNPDGSITGVSGAISIASGAVINVSAQRPGDRLVDLDRNGVTYYEYVQGDVGGNVTLSAPVINQAGQSTVNVSVADASSVVGAGSVTLEGVKEWDLAAVAASGFYTGVTQTNANTVTLNVTTGLDTTNADGSLNTVAGLNFLGDNGAGTVVNYVQNFNVSADDANLGGLASQSNFQARPGLDLTYNGNIVLASAWNLGAGTVNQTAALASGYMQTNTVTGQNYILNGEEANILAYDTTLTYRVGGSVTGAAPIVDLRASGNLNLQGSVTDGFFEYRDQYDPTFQSYLHAGSALDPTYNFTLGKASTSIAFETYSQYLVDNGAGNYLNETNLDNAPGSSVSSAGATYNAPYSTLANSPAAQVTGNAGDVIDNQQVFPLLPNGSSVNSSNYNFVAGAVLGSADPLRISSDNNGTLSTAARTVQTLTFTGIAPTPQILFNANPGNGKATITLPSTDWIDSLLAQYPTASANTAVVLNDNSGKYATAIQAFVAANPTGASYVVSGTTKKLVTSFGLLQTFVQQYLFSYLPPPNAGSNKPTAVSLALLPPMVIRTGVGNISLAAADDVDLTGGAPVYATATDVMGVPYPNANATGNATVYQIGGAAVYTVGHPVDFQTETLTDPETGASVTLNPATLLYQPNYVGSPVSYPNGTVSNIPGTLGFVNENPVYLEDGGSVTVTAGADVADRRDLLTLYKLSTNYINQTAGAPNFPWEFGDIGGDSNYLMINPEFFQAGLGTLGGGSITVNAGGNISDIGVVAEQTFSTATATYANGNSIDALLLYGNGNVTLNAGQNILGAQVSIASGVGQLNAGGSIGDGTPIIRGTNVSYLYASDGKTVITVDTPNIANDESVLRLSDATLDLTAEGSIQLEGVRALAAAYIPPNSSSTAGGVTNGFGFYSPQSELGLLANGNVTIDNDPQFLTIFEESEDILYGTTNGVAVYPASLNAISLSGNLNIITGQVGNQVIGVLPTIFATSALLIPSPYGQLNLMAGGNIDPTSIAMLDSDPAFLPGLFSLTTGNSAGLVEGLSSWTFPDVLPTTSDTTKEDYHNPDLTHLDDPEPVYVYADGDIGDSVQGVTLSVPKEARVYAGQDIVNMMFFGQNLSDNDITRIVAGRDIIGTSVLEPETTYVGTTAVKGASEPAMQGNTFVIGGPGDFDIEAGRNLGPFLNSATFSDTVFDNYNDIISKATMSLAGGILSVGNDWNPYLPTNGANLTVMFGVGKGAAWDTFRDTYVMPGTPENELGGYSQTLIQWMQQDESSLLMTDYGTTDVSADQAYTAFLQLPEIKQHIFLVQDVYYNELQQTATPTGVSYLKYSRGYLAVNTLFPASLGYTANGLEGGATDTDIVETGNLDLRLATIETEFGGNIYMLGPGGSVIAGSDVATSAQAARRSYDGVRLYNADTQFGYPLPTPITSIPPGEEGIMTLRGGSINTFTDGDFLLNQSRIFTEQGGNILMWSSNADLNAGAGAKTTTSFPPIVVHISNDGLITDDIQGGVTGAGIATLQSLDGVPRGDVYLIAPRGTVDFGDAGVRVSGNIVVAALHVANADNLQAQGTVTGVPEAAKVDTGALADAADALGSALDNNQIGLKRDAHGGIDVQVLGYGGMSDDDSSLPTDQKGKNQ